MSRKLAIRRLVEAGQITLHLSGAIEVDDLIELRDVAFTAIGERPTALRIDVTNLLSSLELPAVQTLITITRVAKMVKVGCTIQAGADFEELLRATGLGRMLILESPKTDSTLLLCSDQTEV